MEIIFNYRPEGREIETNKGTKKIMVIRRGPRGLVSVVQGMGPIVIWGNDVADDHINDVEEVLIEKLIEIINN
jgi:hypothetical protein